MNFKSRSHTILYLIGMQLIAFVFWNTLLIYPIKLFVVMLHEMSHGLMAVLFGGKILQIQIDSQIGGYCEYQIQAGFWGQFMTASAGYLGSLIGGIIILLAAIKFVKDKYITLIIGLILLLLSYFVLQSGELFGTAITLGFGLFMMLAFKYGRPLFHDLFLKFIGITSCVYVIIDIKEDVLFPLTNQVSDAHQIANLTGIPSRIVGIIWILIALLLLFYAFQYIYRNQKRG